MHTKNGSNNSLIMFFGLTYLISWIIWVPLITFAPHATYLHQLGGMGPLIAALIMTYILQGKKELWRFMRAMLSFKLPWLLCGFLTPFLLFFISAAIATTMGSSPAQFSLLFTSQEYPRIGIVYWIVSIICYGFGEQVGWRGFALPHLMKNGMSAFKASTLLSVVWAFWHLPLFWYSGSSYMQMNIWMILGWYISLLLSSYLLTWLYLTSGRSVVTVALFHAAIDITLISQAAGTQVVQIMSTLLMLLGVVVVLFSGKSLKGRSTRA
ncbi:MAG: hypothetical protein RI947_789 [Candidatus Parcubacteria bacterium]